MYLRITDLGLILSRLSSESDEVFNDNYVCASLSYVAEIFSNSCVAFINY